MCLEAGAPVALSSDAHVPADVGAGYDQALELLERLGVNELCVVRHRLRRGPGAVAAREASQSMSLVGIGYDSHRLAPGRRLILGGVEIPHELGLEGHSDADVLTHALIDALLGAAGLGDIGEHFPDTDARYRGRRLDGLLGDVVERLLAAGLRVENVDCTVVMERPKLEPARDAIRGRLARTLRPRPARVNVKASTGERIGLRRSRRGRGGARDREPAPACSRDVAGRRPGL